MPARFRSIAAQSAPCSIVGLAQARIGAIRKRLNELVAPMSRRTIRPAAAKVPPGGLAPAEAVLRQVQALIEQQRECAALHDELSEALRGLIGETVSSIGSVSCSFDPRSLAPLEHFSHASLISKLHASYLTQTPSDIVGLHDGHTFTIMYDYILDPLPLIDVVAPHATEVMARREYKGVVESIDDGLAHLTLETADGGSLQIEWDAEDLASRGIGERQPFTLQTSALGGNLAYTFTPDQPKALSGELQTRIRELRNYYTTAGQYDDDDE